MNETTETFIYIYIDIDNNKHCHRDRDLTAKKKAGEISSCQAPKNIDAAGDFWDSIVAQERGIPSVLGKPRPSQDKLLLEFRNDLIRF